MSKVSTIAACMMIGVTQAVATTFYVTPRGNDANRGTTLQQAWRSPAKIATAILQPDDSVLFEGGATFTGTLSFVVPFNGTRLRPVTFTSFPTARGRRARILSGTETGFSAENCSGISISNLDFEGSGMESNSTRGISIVVRLPGSAKMEGLMIDSVEVRGYQWGGIVMEGARERSGLASVIITHCDVHDNGDVGIMSDGVFDPHSPGYNHRNITVAYCKVHDNPGIAGKGSHSGNGILLASVDSALIEHNEAYNNGRLNDNEGGGPVGIWCWESSHVLIQHNESHHNRTGNAADGGGFDFDGGTTHSLMQYNFSHDNAGPGYLIAQFAGARALHDVTIRYNISENDNGGFLLWTGDSTQGVVNADIYNNTVVTTSSGGVSITGKDFSSTRVLNNIIQTAEGVPLIDAKFTPAIQFLGNCFWTTGGDFLIRWGSATFTSLDAWRDSSAQETLTGHGPTGLHVDPLLERPGNTLKVGSPLIDTGLNLFTIFGIDQGQRDFFGHALPQRSGYDVGADEHE